MFWMMNMSQPRNKHSCGIVHCNFLLLKTRPPYLFTDCAVFQKNTRSKMYSFGWSSLQVLKSYSKYKRAKAWGDNIVIDVNCQITWYISDSSKLSIDPNLHEMQSEDFLLTCKMHNGGSEILGKNVRLQHLKFDGRPQVLWASNVSPFFVALFAGCFFFQPAKKMWPTTLQSWLFIQTIGRVS